MNTKNAIDHAANGYDVKLVHSGQKRRYGDSFVEYTVKTDKPQDEVEEYCTKSVYKCGLTAAEYLKDERAGVKDFGDHFRFNYSIKRVKDGEYFYRVVKPSTD